MINYVDAIAKEFVNQILDYVEQVFGLSYNYLNYIISRLSNGYLIIYFTDDLFEVLKNKGLDLTFLIRYSLLDIYLHKVVAELIKTSPETILIHNQIVFTLKKYIIKFEKYDQFHREFNIRPLPIEKDFGKVIACIYKRILRLSNSITLFIYCYDCYEKVLKNTKLLDQCTYNQLLNKTVSTLRSLGFKAWILKHEEPRPHKDVDVVIKCSCSLREIVSQLYIFLRNLASVLENGELILNLDIWICCNEDECMKVMSSWDRRHVVEVG